MTTDTELLDWLEKHKHATFTPANFHVRRTAARVDLAWLPERGVMHFACGETVREVIRRAMAADDKLALWS